MFDSVKLRTFLLPATGFMEFIFGSALCSIAVALLLKHTRDLGYDTWQLIGWNYAAAVILCVSLLQPASAPFTEIAWAQLPWDWLSLLALTLPCVFLVYSFALTHAGIVRSEIAQRLSLVIALAAAFSFMGDNLDWIKFTGLALGFVAVGLLLLRGKAASSPGQLTSRAAASLLAVWLGYGFIDIALKQVAASGVALGTALSIAFTGAGLLMLAALCLRRSALGLRRSAQTGARPSRGRHLFLGVALGGLNFANIYLYIHAHRLFAEQPAVVFASMNFLVVALGVLSARVLFKEPISRTICVALLLCFAAIGLLTFSQWR